VQYWLGIRAMASVQVLDIYLARFQPIVWGFREVKGIFGRSVFGKCPNPRNGADRGFQIRPKANK
jgi:hypothetical protein